MFLFSVEQNVERGALNVEEGTKNLSQVSACILRWSQWIEVKNMLFYMFKILKNHIIKVFKLHL